MVVKHIERSITMDSEIEYDYKTITHGPFSVTNVPHAKYPGGYSPSGSEHHITAPVLNKILQILEHMEEYQIYEFNYDDYL